MRNLIIVVLLSTLISAGVFAPAQARKWTIYERQSVLLKRVNKAEKSNELTFKEARNLRDKLADVQKDKQKMLDKNGGRLAYIDRDKLEARLNNISDRIWEKKLDKRVASRYNAVRLRWLQSRIR